MCHSHAVGFHGVALTVVVVSDFSVVEVADTVLVVVDVGGVHGDTCW